MQASPQAVKTAAADLDLQSRELQLRDLPLRQHLRHLSGSVDELDGKSATDQLPDALRIALHNETWRLSFSRAKAIAAFALLYAALSIALNPQLLGALLGTAGVAVEPLAFWALGIRFALIAIAVIVLVEGWQQSRVKAAVGASIGNASTQAPPRFRVAIIRGFVVALLLAAGADIVCFPSPTVDLTSYALAMCLIAVVLVTPDQSRIAMYVVVTTTVYFAWELIRNTGQRWNVSLAVWLAIICALCITLDRLTLRQRIETLIAFRRAELQERIARALLDNTLPQPVSAELANHQGAVAQQYDAAIVLFADIVGFTSLAAKVPPQQLLNLLDEVFCEFDSVVLARGMEKIKTIGDAYMAAGGLTQSTGATADNAVALGRDMLAIVRRIGERDGVALNLRVGINLGPVVAGVIGDLRFAYDVWGDTVNTASRLESTGLAGHIQISESLQQQLSDPAAANARGIVDLKGLGTRATWLIA
jgi:class 3 adenylate cyclase